MLPMGAGHGSFMSFTYMPPQGLASNDPSKEIMILNPNYKGQIHGIDLKRVTPAERMVLTMIMDPETKEHPETIPYPLVRDVISRMDPIMVVKNPLNFYQRFVKPFIRNKDVYRKYDLRWVTNAKVIDASKVSGPMKPFVPAKTFTPMFNKGNVFKKI